jgi:hypothetical protein
MVVCRGGEGECIWGLVRLQGGTRKRRRKRRRRRRRRRSGGREGGEAGMFINLRRR